VKREYDNGELEIFEELRLIEHAIPEYFTEIYKRPVLMLIQVENKG
jgi:hypothetical protein